MDEGKETKITNKKYQISNSSSKAKRRSWKLAAVALYITFLLLSSIPFMADNVIEPKMKDVYEYHLVYRTNGRQGHYFVTREDSSEIGTVDLIYTTKSNSLSVVSKNIKVLHIYCRSMYEDECRKVFGFDPSDNSNYYKWYFIEKNHLTVNVESETIIKDLTFIDTPVPYEVYVNGDRWYEGRQYNYTDSYKTVLSNVPKGNSHIDIYFKSPDKNKPFAHVKADRVVVNVNIPVYFDASSSYDPDGEIIAYIWDFGDGNNSGGVVNAHTYTQPGYYAIILTVRDNEFMVDHAYLNITVIKGSTKPVINGIIPNQLKEEDSPPWSIKLKQYGMDFDGSVDDLKWYLVGENVSMYNVVGENSTEQNLIFSIVPNAYGTDLVDIYVSDKDGYNASQKLWINITAVNDKPVIRKLPHLIVHYDVPYRFAIADYISDVETPYNELNIDVVDQLGSDYIIHLDEEIIIEYPKDYIGKDIFATITVSDGEDITNAILGISVSDNWPPIKSDQLPDIILEEGEALYNAFKLNDYFSDPDGNELYFTFSESNLQIFINENSSVDFISRGHWVGEETVIFRAQDEIGAIVEDSIKISVVPMNDPPNIREIPDLKVHFDLDYYFDISYYVSDSDNELYELILTTTDPDHIRISPDNNLGMIIKYPKSMLGITIKVDITVSDGVFESSKPVFITVMKEYPPELIKRLPDVSFNEDERLVETFDLDDHFLDLDNDTLYYTTGNEDVEVFINPDHKVTFDSTPNWYGYEKIIFRATDPSGALVEDSIIVTVVPINDPPTFLSLPKVVINESETVEFDLKPYIYDIDDNISKLVISIDDQNVFVSGTSLVIFGSKSLPSDHDIMVTDGVYTVTRTLQIKVVPKQMPNDNSVDDIVYFFIGLLIVIIIMILIIILYIRYRSQKYDVEEIFLIHNSGKLLNHIYCKSHSKFDDEIFSGMFTAIQQFIEDTFSTDDDCNDSPVSISNLKSKTFKQNQKDAKTSKKPLKLNEFKVGDNQVIIEHGKFLFMAVVYSGPGAKALHRAIENSIQTIEEDFGDKLEYWDGDIKEVSGIKEYLETLLPEKRDETSNKLTFIPTRSKSTINELLKPKTMTQKETKVEVEPVKRVKRKTNTRTRKKSKSISKSIPISIVGKKWN